MTGSSKPGVTPARCTKVSVRSVSTTSPAAAMLSTRRVASHLARERGQDGMDGVRPDVAVARQGDVPIVDLRVEEPAELIEVHHGPRLADPTGHGKVVLDDGRVFLYSHGRSPADPLTL